MLRNLRFSHIFRKKGTMFLEKAIYEQINFIKDTKGRYGLSADQICDIVSHSGGFVSIHTVRRLLAPDAEKKRFRADTVSPVYDALLTLYGSDGSDGFTAPTYAYPFFDRRQYEQLIAALKDTNSRLLGEVSSLKAENAEKDACIEKQKAMIDVLWHGLLTFGQSSEEYNKILDYYKKEG